MSFRRSKCGVTFFFYVFKEKKQAFLPFTPFTVCRQVSWEIIYRNRWPFQFFLYRKNKSLYKFSENVARFFYSFLLVVLLLPFIFPFSEAL